VDQNFRGFEVSGVLTSFIIKKHMTKLIHHIVYGSVWVFESLGRVVSFATWHGGILLC
jgi:hypothetical protein